MCSYILCCSCKGMRKFSEDSFSLLFDDKVIPEVFVGKSQILTLVEKLPEGNFKEYAKALSKNKEKYSYYFEADNGNIVLQYNLKTGMKVL